MGGTGRAIQRILDTGDAQAVLASVTDESLRQRAMLMWRSHLEAGVDRFLQEPALFEVAPVFSPGQSLVDRFQIERLLGKGGMGEVYLAWDRKLNERVALKTVARLLLPSEGIRRRFLAEVQNARRITHPNVCRIYDLFEDGNLPFFVMEYLDGPSLADWSPKKGRTETIALLRQIAEGLAAAHLNGIVHGDFKPANVIVAKERPVITDFGLARAISDVSTTSHEHSDGAGTRQYMAPELLDGGRPTVRSDVFAFGKVAEEILPGLSLWPRCTREKPEERPESISEVIRKMPGDNTRRYFAGATIVAAAGAAAFWRPSVDKFILTSGTRLLVNGFRALDVIAPRARLARGVFLTALRQSPRLQTVSDQDLLPSLARLTPGATLPAEGVLLQRLLSLHRAEFWIDARLEHARNRFTLFLQVLRGTDALVVWQQTIRNVPNVVQTAELAAAALRRAAGESEASMEANPAETTAYTSRFPEALESYHEAMNYVAAGQVAPAIPLLETAIRLDPAFAQAHSTLGLCHIQYRRHEIAFRLAEKGWQLSSALPERERAAVEATYYNLQDDPEKMVETARRAVSFFPGEPRYRRNLAQVLCRRGDASEGVEELRKALAIVPDADLMRNELLVELCEAGRFAEALNIYRKALAEGRPAAPLAGGAGLAYLGVGNAPAALRMFESVPKPNPRLVQGAKVMAGMLDSAIAGLLQDLAASQRDSNAIDAHQVREFLCGIYFLTDRPALALSEVRAMSDLPLVPASARFLQCTAFWAARVEANDTLASCVALAAQLATRWPNGQTRAADEYINALTRQRQGDLADAERRLLASLGFAPTVWAYFDIADLFAKTGRAALAEEYWRRFETRHGYVLKLWFPGLVLYGWLLRARAAASRNDLAVARECSSKILNHWARRNPGLRLVQAALQLNPSWTEPKGN